MLSKSDLLNLQNMMINDWDAFGEWSHSVDKHKYKDFRQAMDSIRQDLFPRRTTLRLRKLSGKFKLDGHAHRERAESSAPLFPISGFTKGANDVHAESTIVFSSVF